MDIDTIVRFSLLGLGIGALYGVVAHGIVLVYRGSGILNFAQGAFVMVGAYVYYEFAQRPSVPLGVGVLAAPLVGALVGALTYRLVIRPMRSSSPLSRVIATLAVLIVLQALAVLRFGVDSLGVRSWLPTRPVEIIPGAPVGLDRLVILALGVLLTVVLTIVYRRTQFGRITSAVAENERAAASLGHAPERIALANWALGSALAALVGALLAPITFLQPATLVMLVVPALAAALIGGFNSFTWAFVGALGIGVSESLMARYVATPGWSQSVPFLVLIAVLVIRGSSLPLRSHVLDRLPAVGDGKVKVVPVVVLFAICVTGFGVLLGTRWVDALTVTMTYGILCLSVVVITGYAGQLSLAQFVMAGLGAFVAAKLSNLYEVTFAVALVCGVGSAAIIGLIVGVPSLRTRGVNLAIATLGLAIVVYSLVLVNYQWTGGTSGLPVPSPRLFGLDVNAITSPRAYALMVLVVLFATCLAVANLRRGVSGRRMLAVRSNERAAAALGVDVFGAKLYAFALASGIAGLAGVLLGFRLTNVISSQFNVLTSITVVGMTVVGGVGFIGGAILGSTLLPGGFGSALLRDLHGVDRYLPLISGVFLLYVLRTDQTGLYAMNRHLVHTIAGKIRGVFGSGEDAESPPEPGPDSPAMAPSTRAVERVTPNHLVVQGVTVQFGGVRAVDDVSLEVLPGEVHGLIGPNGAGKTTFIDAVTGFVRPARGSVRLGDRELLGLSARTRSRLGLARSFQSLELFSDLTIEENLAVACDDGSKRRYVTDLVVPGRAELSDVARDVVERFGLTDVLGVSPEAISFGRRRLVAIARAVAMSPSVIMLDEPAAGLDDHESSELAGMIRSLADDRGMAVLLVEHNTDLVLGISDRVTVLAGGAVLRSDVPSVIRRDPEVLSVYLGESDDVAATSELA